MLIRYVTTDTFNPSIALDGNDIALSLSRDLTVDLSRRQAEDLAVSLNEALSTEN